jgi:ferrous iron transport protein A
MVVVDNSLVSLADLKPGDERTVLSVVGSDAIAQRLSDLGFVPGTPVRVVRRAPLGDPVAFRMRDTTLCLRRAQARRVLVS